MNQTSIKSCQQLSHAEVIGFLSFILYSLSRANTHGTKDRGHPGAWNAVFPYSAQHIFVVSGSEPCFSDFCAMWLKYSSPMF